VTFPGGWYLGSLKGSSIPEAVAREQVIQIPFPPLASINRWSLGLSDLGGVSDEMAQESKVFSLYAVLGTSYRTRFMNGAFVHSSILSSSSNMIVTEGITGPLTLDPLRLRPTRGLPSLVGLSKERKPRSDGKRQEKR
jgi:hypothetical protein